MSCPRLSGTVSTTFKVAVEHSITDFVKLFWQAWVGVFCFHMFSPTLTSGRSSWRETILRRKVHAYVRLILVHTWPKTILEHPQSWLWVLIVMTHNLLHVNIFLFGFLFGVLDSIQFWVNVAKFEIHLPPCFHLKKQQPAGYFDPPSL